MQAPRIKHANDRSQWPKAAGLVACVLVVGQLLMFAVGEGVEGVGHLVQAAPLVLLMIVAWWRPLIGGTLIVLVGVGLAVTYIFSVGEPHPLVLIMFFAPAIAGGLLLVAAGRLESSQR
jgi:hypothetical protein